MIQFIFLLFYDNVSHPPHRELFQTLISCSSFKHRFPHLFPKKSRMAVSGGGCTKKTTRARTLTKTQACTHKQGSHHVNYSQLSCSKDTIGIACRVLCEIMSSKASSSFLLEISRITSSIWSIFTLHNLIWGGMVAKGWFHSWSFWPLWSAIIKKKKKNLGKSLYM